MFRLTLVCLTFVMLISACRRDGATSWDIDGKAPLVKGRLTWFNVFDDSTLQVGDDGVLHLMYRQSLLNIDLDTLVAIDDTLIRNSFEPPFIGGPILIPPGTEIFGLEENIVLKAEGAQLREARIASGTLTYTVKSYVNGALQVQYNLPGVILPAGSPLNLNIETQAAQGTTPWEASSMIDMSGVSIDLQGISGSSFNRLASNLSVRASATATESVPVMGDDSVSIELRFENVRVAYGKGYFGQSTADLNERAEVLPFTAIGNLDLERLNLSLLLTNRVGADVRFDLHRLTAISDQGETNLLHAVLNQPLNITRATDVNGQVTGETYSIELSDENSNILDFLARIPQEVEIDATVELNPLGNIAGSNDFIYTAEPFDAELVVDLPMNFGTSGIVLRDTLETGRIEGDITGNGALTLQFTNAFPLHIAALDMTFLGASNESFELVDGLMIESAQYLALNDVVPVVSTYEVTLTRDQLETMKEGGRVILQLQFSTYNGQQVQFGGQEYLDVSGILDGVLQVSYQ